jgi:hypothetical protein
MSRIRNLAVLTAVAAIALSGFALAATSTINGGSTRLSISPTASKALATHHLTVRPLVPATADGSNFNFPIAAGRLDKSNLRGVIFNRGGFAISNGTRTIKIRRPTILSKQHGVSVWALIGTRWRLRCTHTKHHGCFRAFLFSRRRIGRITNISRSGNSASGTLRLTKVSARAINTLAGRVIAKRGSAIGTITIAPTFR